MKFFLLIFKNLRRNKLRSLLTGLGTMVLVFVVTLVWSVLHLLDTVMTEKASNIKAIVTERWQVPSKMPFAYAQTLATGAASDEGDVVPEDSMSWQFYGGTIDPKKKTFDSILFAIAMEPAKIATMLDDLDELEGEPKAMLAEGIRKLEENRQGIIIGRTRLKTLKKQIGDRLTITSMNYKDINLEFEVVGTFPDGRYDQTACMNRDYLNRALDDYARTHNGKAHPLAGSSLNLVWIKVPDRQAFGRVTEQIMSSPMYTSPSVKCETASSAVASFLEAYRDLIWGMRFLLSPAILITLSLVISNAISISVRERRMEMAVLKVLGFRPSQLLLLVIGEALLLGTLAGLISTSATYYLVNHVIGGIKFPIAFFPAFFIPLDAMWWGLAIGSATALIGSIMPAWSARTVKVSDVFSKVA